MNPDAVDDEADKLGRAFMDGDNDKDEVDGFRDKADGDNGDDGLARTFTGCAECVDGEMAVGACSGRHESTWGRSKLPGLRVDEESARRISCVLL